MNRRLLFFTGHLSGLVIGATLVWICFANSSIKNPTVYNTQQIPVVVPVSYPSVPNAGQLPNGWELRFFNGQPFYIIPVDMEKRISKT